MAPEVVDAPLLARGCRLPGGHQIQIQSDYGGRPLEDIAAAGLGVFDMVPDYRRRCPACGGARCAVRHGTYTRRVVSRGTIHEKFPVPRFRCRKRGPRPSSAATFSVLPEQLLPRKQPSLSLAVWMMGRLVVEAVSLSKLLDELADAFHRCPEPWLPEVSTIYRLLRLFARARRRLDPLLQGSSAAPVGGTLSGSPPGAPEGTARHRAFELLQILADQRGPPIVGRYHREFFPRLLFGIHSQSHPA